MAKKAKVPDEGSIALKDVLPAVDRKDRDWWNSLNPKQKEKFPAWLYMRYCSTVNGSPDVSRYYVMAVNETVNKRFNALRKHQHLQYLLMTAASPGIGTQYHTYIPPLKRGGGKKKFNLLTEIFPHYGDQEIEVLTSIISEEEIYDHLIAMGWTDKEIKDAMAKVEDSPE